MNLNQHFEVGCIFKAEVFKDDGTITQETGEFHNMVLDCGLLSMYDYPINTLATYINIGSSSVAPASSQTGLQDWKLSSNTKFVADATAGSPITSSITEVANFNEMIYVRQFAVGTCTGDFTEVGFSRLSNSGYFNRQLFKDSNGNPMIVRVGADEGLRITAKVRLYCAGANIFGQIWKLEPFGATSGSITITGNYAVTFTVADLEGDKLELTKKFSDLFTGQAGTIYTVTGNKNTGFLIHSALKRAYGASFPLSNLTITANTLSGNSSPPQLSVHQAYNLDTLAPLQTLTLTDATLGTTENKDYRVVVPVITAESEVYLGWNCNFYSNTQGAFFSSAIKDFDFGVGANILGAYLMVPTSCVTIVAPSAGNLVYQAKTYYAPGKLSTGNFTIKAFGMHPSALSTQGSHCCHVWLLETGSEILVKSTESFEFYSTVTWGRYVA